MDWQKYDGMDQVIEDERIPSEDDDEDEVEDDESDESSFEEMDEKDEDAQNDKIQPQEFNQAFREVVQILLL